MSRRIGQSSQELRHAIEVFVRGFCAGKSAAHPYEGRRVGPLWVMRDVERKDPKLYRKEEWIAWNVVPDKVDAAARAAARGRFFVCAIQAMNESDGELRRQYKALGYRLLGTESLFVHRLKRIAQAQRSVTIERVETPEMALRFCQATRTRPIADKQLQAGAPFRQYVAIDNNELVGWVRSIDAAGAAWCTNMDVRPSHRRRGIGRSLLFRMLRDDRARGATKSVLLSSHAGALLYPEVGYEQLGMLLIFAPGKVARSTAPGS